MYHWASVTPGPRYGRVVGFYAGHLGWWGWMFGLASIVYIPANVIIQMYAVYHPDFAQQPWHIYLTYVLVTWFCVAVVVWGNRFMPMLQTFGLFVVCIGGPVTIIVLAAMPKTHASHSFVWTDFQNVTGWSNGGAFLAGVLKCVGFISHVLVVTAHLRDARSGAFTIGTPDSVTHVSCITSPGRNLTPFPDGRRTPSSAERHAQGDLRATRSWMHQYVPISSPKVHL